MGVKGLWSLLNPVARPVQIESMEGKRLAIDSSIWLYQFQATMRDKDGRVLVNAHVLGFLRRINKLLFHGIKPVFVFDGGAPALKRSTIAERKRKKQGAAINHAKTAEKLFAAQMRREAVKAAQAQREAQAAREAQHAAAAASHYDDDAGDMIDENAVYLEDLERTGNAPPRTRPDPTPHGSSSSITRPAPVPVEEPPDPREERRKKFKKHDPYRLPAADMPTVSTEDKPDARLATEAELQQFIDDMRPSDIDIESAEFRALPTEVQYEIIGDMRIRSRQQSHKRLSDMLRKAPTAMDFSMAQIKGLSQRNVLTQQLLTVTDMVGQAHLTIPVRIAAERNREYVLLKRGEDVGGGWALGIREGSKQMPIEVEKESESDGRSSSSSEDEESEDDFEEIKPPIPKVDPDLAAERRRQVLDAISARYAPANPRPSRPSRIVPVTSFGAAHAPNQPHLFAPDDDGEDEGEDVDRLRAEADVVPTANDEALALALQQEELGSDEDEADPDLARALALSRADRDRETASQGAPSARTTPALSRQSSGQETMDYEEGDDSDESMEEVSLVPSGRSTPAVFEPSTEEEAEDDYDEFEEVDTPPLPAAGQPDMTGQAAKQLGPVSGREGTRAKTGREAEMAVLTKGFDDAAMTVDFDAVGEMSDDGKMEPVMEVSSTGIAGTTVPTVLTPTLATQGGYSKDRMRENAETDRGVIEIKDEDDDDVVPISPPSDKRAPLPPSNEAVPPLQTTPAPPPAPAPMPAPVARSATARPRPPVAPSRSSSLLNKPNIPSPLSRSPSISMMPNRAPSAGPSRSASASVPPARLERDAPSPPSPVLPLSLVAHEPDRMIDEALASGMKSRTPSISISDRHRDGNEKDHDDASDGDGDYEDDSRSIEWSRSPSPPPARSHHSATPSSAPQRPPLQPNQSVQSVDSTGSAEAPDFDEGEDVDMNANDMVEEQDDYARFLANIKNRDLNEVRGEIDDEIRILNGQNKVAMRDSDEITLAMVAQIQTLLRHFGIPYITAPMEAEAQCAKLAELGLVDGIITDDSDVFLFGGVQCFKNIFNDSKYAECFLSSDLDRELSLTRERLISLAYLLGSDYTIGLPGVGPVVALELMANFPGPNGIEEFKAWWTKVQRGQDGDETDTKWKQSFKKRYNKLIFLTADWPNPLVREAYLYPTTDESDEPFHWGFPKLSALRSFLHEELSWSISKVDDELTPIVQRIARRGKDGAMNKQSTLTSFFDSSAGALANYAPRKKTTANVSKRLLTIIKQFREAEARVAGAQMEGLGVMLSGVDQDDPKGRQQGVKRARSESEMLLPVDASVEDLDKDMIGEKVKLARKRAPRRKKSDASMADSVDTDMADPVGDSATVKRKTAPRKRKAPVANQEAAADGDGNGGMDGGDGAEYTPKPIARARASGSKAKKRAVAGAPGAATRGEGVDETMGDDEVPSVMADDISQVPPEDRGKWRRQQQKKWRRAAVAGSVRPDR